jgi:hypothetical protein
MTNIETPSAVTEPTIAPAHFGGTWLAPLALLLAVAALALSSWSAFRPSAVGNDTHPVTADDAAAARDEACTAAEAVQAAVRIQTNIDAGRDPANQQAVAANARLAALGGGQYLLTTLTDATPPDVSESVRALARALAGVGINQLADVPSDDLAQIERLNEAREASRQLGIICR